MGKDNYVLVSLDEPISKELAQALSNETSRAIMKLMAGKENATETEIAEALELPLSTVHYNIQNLVKAGLVKKDEFHYSERGKEVIHYALTNKTIVIAPNKKDKTAVKRLLPTLAVVGVAALLIEFLRAKLVPRAEPLMAAAPETKSFELLAGQPAVNQPFYASVSFWFVIGAIVALVVYCLISWWTSRKT